MRRLTGFFQRKDGAIAVEFAFVAPVMIGLFFGLTELALALGARGDVTNLASTGADLIAQESSAGTADMSNVFAALTAMLYPYPTSNAQITISSVIDDNSGGSAGKPNPTGKVAWSCTKGGTARSGTYTFPDAAKGVITSGSGGSVIMAEVSYSYSLPFKVTIPGVINLSGPYPLSSTFYSKPRKVLQVTKTTACP